MDLVQKLSALVELLIENETIIEAAEAEREWILVNPKEIFEGVVSEADLPTDNDEDDPLSPLNPADPPKIKFNLTEPQSSKKPKRLSQRRKMHSAKVARDHGDEYSTFSGKTMPAREQRPPCDASCRLRCRDRFAPDERTTLFRHFWRLGDHKSQWDFIGRNLRVAPKKLCTAGEESRRANTRTYYFWVGEERRQVCKTMFLNTLGISSGWVGTVCKKLMENGSISEDGRGKLGNRRKKAYAPVGRVCGSVKCEEI